ncbi:MAG: hypothetical protein AAF692_11395 [Pseudomonadota bacterium]
MAHEDKDRLASDRRKGDRRKAQVPFDGPDRRQASRRTGTDRRTSVRRSGDRF